MNPGFNLGPLRLHYYGLILGLAILVAYYFLRARAKKAQFPLSVIDTVFLLSVPLAIIGARLYFVLFNLEVYLADPSRILAFWEGGLAIHGALLGGLVGALIAWIVTKRRKIKASFGRLLDLIAPPLLLAQAIGRFANFVNQEAFGRPTDLPWGIFIAPEQRPPGLEEFSSFHPTFAYEAIWNLIGVGLLLWAEKRWSFLRGAAGSAGKASGSLFALYLIWYSFGRFFIEALRTDSLFLGNLRVAQLVSVLGVIGGLGYIWYRKKQWTKTQQQTQK